MVNQNRFIDFEKKFKIYKIALNNFKLLLNEDIEQYKDTLSEIIIDGINNGKIQKFEYCAELTWKIIKRFLYDYAGIDIKTPKGAIKEFYKAAFCDEDTYLTLIDIIDDRNNLSHIYSIEFFKDFILKLDKYCSVMYFIADKICKEISLK